MAVKEAVAREAIKEVGNGSRALLLHRSVQQYLSDYMIGLGEKSPDDLYQVLLNTVELAMLKFLQEKTNKNQSKMARFSGLSRVTLRKKLKQHGFIMDTKPKRSVYKMKKKLFR